MIKEWLGGKYRFKLKCKIFGVISGKLPVDLKFKNLKRKEKDSRNKYVIEEWLGGKMLFLIIGKIMSYFC